MNPKVVRVNRCDNEIYWYSSHIGEVFQLKGECGDAYVCIDIDGKDNKIFKSDGEVFDVQGCPSCED